MMSPILHLSKGGNMVRTIGNIIAVSFILIGYIGLKIVRRRPSTSDKEAARLERERIAEEERLKRENAELDNYFSGEE